jgi:hypothetical protein
MSWFYVWLALLLLTVFVPFLADSPLFKRLLERRYGPFTSANILGNMQFAAGLMLIVLFFWGLLLGLLPLLDSWKKESDYRRYEQIKTETFKERLTNHGLYGKFLAPLMDIEERTQRLEEMMSDMMKVLVSLHEQVQGCQVKPSDKAAASTGAPDQTCAWQQE